MHMTLICIAFVLGPSRSGDLGKRPALKRLRIDTVRNWLENRHVDEDHSGSTDSGDRRRKYSRIASKAKTVQKIHDCMGMHL